MANCNKQKNQKSKMLISVSYIALIFFAILLAGKTNAEMLANFDFVDNDVTQGFDGWHYSPYGDTSCAIYNAASQSKMCSTDSDGHIRSFFYYYNGYNSDHMDWLRWGFIDSEDNLAINGNSLKIVFTGGAYNDNGTVAYAGKEVRSKEQFDELVTQDINPYADRVLPGGLTLYFKGDGDFNTFEEFSGADRLSMWILPPENSSYTFENQKLTSTYTHPATLFSWYPFVDDAGGDHYYHHLANVNMGGWIHMVFDAHPVHNNSGDNNPYDYYRVGGYDYPGDAINYFEHINAFAIKGVIVKNLESPSYLYLDEIKAYKVDQPENDETIANIGVGYDPLNKRFDISFDDKYRCGDCSAKYEVRYSFSPITNANYNSAKLAKITNFNRNIVANPGEVIKSSNGYSQIWAGIDVEESDKVNLVDGATIYFAVKDLSDRSNLADRDTYDLETVPVEGVGDVRRVDLIKTIDYTIYPVNRPLVIKTQSLEDAHVGVAYSVQLEAKGGTQPYLWQAVSALPDGLTITMDGLLSGAPTTFGSYDIEFSVTDSHQVPQKTNATLTLNVYESENCADNIDNDNDGKIDCADEDCEDSSNCSDVLVDFGANAGNNVFGTTWNNVFMDTYTDYVNMGPGGTKTVTGNNGSYNYQGVEGDAFSFNKGDKIKVYWYNNSSNTISFIPRISFEDKNRENSAPDGIWYDMSYVDATPLSTSVSEYIIGSASAGNHSLVNISSNSNETNSLVCDKIIWVHSGDNNPPTPITYNLSNFTSLVTNWLGIGDNNSDVNNDGIVNTRDLGIMMSNWEE